MSATTDIPVVRLKLDEWGEIIRELAEAQATQKEAEAQARNAAKTVKALTQQVRKAMNGRPVARCGKATITAVDKPGSHGWLTQTNGTTIPYPEITAFLLGNQQVLAENVRSITSGRASSKSVTIAGEP